MSGSDASISMRVASRALEVRGQLPNRPKRLDNVRRHALRSNLDRKRGRQRKGQSHMQIEKAAPRIGAIVTGVDVRRLGDQDWQKLYQAWLDAHVLIVRGQTLTKPEYLAYSRRFGRLKPHRVKKTRDPENPEITLMGVTSIAKDAKGEKLILNRGQGWHTDSPWDTEI